MKTRSYDIQRTFETERLLLVPTGLEDIEFIIKLMNMPKWLEFIGDRNVRTPDEAHDYLSNKIIKERIEMGVPNFTVILKSDNSKIGKCGLVDRDGLDCMDLGFSFLPEFEGKGYGYESSVEVIRIAKEIMSLEKLCAITLPINYGSRALLRKLDFSHTKMIYLKNDPNEIMYFERKI